MALYESTNLMKTIKIQFWELSEIKETPIIDRCRYLIKKGEPEDTRLEIYRENEEPDITVKHIGNAAKLRVSDCYFKIDRECVDEIAHKPGCSPVR